MHKAYLLRLVLVLGALQRVSATAAVAVVGVGAGVAAGLGYGGQPLRIRPHARQW